MMLRAAIVLGMAHEVQGGGRALIGVCAAGGLGAGAVMEGVYTACGCEGNCWE